ncbi:MAG TPA: four helix bundle protein [Terriglobales bacterium]|nr:four helix bundle protein [Terriglobales bacterium]
MSRTYRELLVWQKAKHLATLVYCETEGFPRSEIFGLTSQIRRAAISIPSNIAEGQGRDEGRIPTLPRPSSGFNPRTRNSTWNRA